MEQERLEKIRNMCMMNDIFMSSVLQSKKCAEKVLRIILEDPELKVLEVDAGNGQ